MTPHMQPFFLALQEILLDGEPKPQRKPAGCRWCGDTGERGEGGGGCSWCEPWDGVVDGSDD